MAGEADYSKAVFDSETIEAMEKENKKREGALKYIQEETKKIKKMSHKKFAKWLMEQHDEYIEHIKYAIFNGANFLEGSEYEERYMILTYMHNLVLFLDMREIEHISEKVIEILRDKGYNDLIVILNALNYF